MTRARAPRARSAPGSLDGVSRAIARVREQIQAAAPTRATVLIEGEPGSGRHRVARALHDGGARPEAPWVELRLGASAPASEAALFGRGAARGAVERAGRGTLLLADVEKAAPATQLALLRLVQDRRFERMGGGGVRRAEARFVATTGADLAAEVRAGRFREDLLYRLSAVRIVLPPLRERREDVPALAAVLLAELARERGRRAPQLSRGALDRLAAMEWPGNVRDLRAVLDATMRAAAGRRTLEVSDLPPALVAPAAGRIEVTVGMTVAEVERLLIEATLAETGHDKRRAAAMLGIGLRTLYRKLDAGSGRARRR